MSPACSADRIFLSSILLSKLRVLSVPLVDFCSVGRIGPSPPRSSDTDDTREAGL